MLPSSMRLFRRIYACTYINTDAHMHIHAHSCAHMQSWTAVGFGRSQWVHYIKQRQILLSIERRSRSSSTTGNGHACLPPEVPMEGTTKVTNGRGLRASVPTRATTETKTAIQRATQRLSSVSRTMNMRRVGQRNRTSRRCVCPSMPSLSILTRLLSCVSVDPCDILSCLITQLGSSKPENQS